MVDRSVFLSFIWCPWGYPSLIKAGLLQIRSLPQRKDIPGNVADRDILRVMCPVILQGRAIGLRSGRKLLHRLACFIHILRASSIFKEKQFEKFEKLPDEQGIRFVIIARFTAVVRRFDGLIAGTGRMNFFLFMITSITGAGLRTLVWNPALYCLYLFPAVNTFVILPVSYIPQKTVSIIPNPAVQHP